MTEFFFGHDASLWETVQHLDDALFDTGFEEPEAGHGAVVNHGVVLAHFQTERVDLGSEVDVDIAVRHAVVAEHMEPHLAVVFLRGFHDLADPAVVVIEFFRDFRRIIANHVE